MAKAADETKPAETAKPFKIEDQPVAPKRAPSLQLQRFGSVEFKQGNYFASIPEGTTLDDVKDPNFWAHVASSITTEIKPFDEIKCVWEDASQYAVLLVIRPTKVSASVVVLQHVDIRAASGDIDFGKELADYGINFVPGMGYRVLYRPDNSVLKEGIPTEGDARGWLIEHLNSGRKKAA